MIAVAEELVSTGVTTPERLAVRGGSNGGLLVGNMLTLRPDLFGSVVCAVPLLDMKRYSHLLAGASWMAEYGDPDTADWDAFLKRYSAYHNIQPGASNYPPLLMTTSTRDDRVHPYHARAFVKRLQDTKEEGSSSSSSSSANGGRSLHYYENIEGGHGGAADAKQQAFMTTLYLDFLKKTIGKGLMK
jgi:prolyl oligopeptidase